MKSKMAKGNPGPRLDPDEILPEYDFSRGRPNKYAARYHKGCTVVMLEPDVAAVFPSAVEVNAALRALAGVIQRHHSARVQSGRESSK